MPLKDLIPLPVRNVLRKPYRAVVDAPKTASNAWAGFQVRRQFDPNGPGVPVDLVDDFRPAIHADAFQPFRSAHVDPEIREEIRHFMGVVRKVADRGECRFLDVGAAFGLFTMAAMHASAGSAQVLALEPSPRVFPYLKWHLERLSTDRIEPVLVAAGETEGEIFLYPPRKGFMMYSAPQWHTESEAVRVAVTTLDIACKQRDFHPDLIKIDVEGYEPEVLRGATRILAEDRPLIFLEVHGGMLPQRGLGPDDAFNPLRAAGYKIEAVDGPTDRIIAELHAGQTRRFFCRPG